MAGVIGDPVRHSLSPALHNAAFATLGLDWVYVAFPVRPGEGEAAVAAMRVLDLAGLSVTMPHKAAVVGGVDRLGPTAARLGVVNTISWAASPDGPELAGDSTDGAGFLDALRGDDGFDPRGRRCLILGAGGAARSVCLALADARAASVHVVAATSRPAEECAALAGPAGNAVVLARRPDSADGARRLAEALEASDLVVNATPVGMAPDDGLPFGMAPELLRADQFVADLIYAPATTPCWPRPAPGGGQHRQRARYVDPPGGAPGRHLDRPARPIEAMSAAALTRCWRPLPRRLT